MDMHGARCGVKWIKISRFYPSDSILPSGVLSAMTNHYPSDAVLLRAEIAAAAARMIAQDGADYGTAKRKAAKQILGSVKVRGDWLPDNAQIEDELRLYNELFFADSQPARLLHLRKMALALLEEFAQFNPFITGAVLNGTAGEHSDIHLQLFAESPKDVEIFMVNLKIAFEVSEAPPGRARNQPVEVLSFLWQDEGVHLALYDLDDLRRIARSKSGGKSERADAAELQALIAESEQ
jgi:hypothetical protein